MALEPPKKLGQWSWAGRDYRQASWVSTGFVNLGSREPAQERLKALPDTEGGARASPIRAAGGGTGRQRCGGILAG